VLEIKPETESEQPLCSSVSSVVKNKDGDGVRHNRLLRRLMTPTELISFCRRVAL